MEQVRQIAEKQKQQYITHYGKHAHIRIIGIEWVSPKEFAPSGYHLLDHKEEWSWMVKFLIYDDASERKPYHTVDMLRVLNDGSIDHMDVDPAI